MVNKSFLEMSLEKDNLIVSFSIFMVVFICSLYTVLGVGMNMSAVEMTRMSGIFSAPDNMSSMPMNKMEIPGEEMDESQMSSHSMTSMVKQSDQMGQSMDKTMDMDMDKGAKPPFSQLTYSITMFLMWWLMMIAMMTPSASSMLLLFFRLKKIGPEKESALRHTYVFLCGYLIMWGVFSIAACSVHLLLNKMQIADEMMMQISSVYVSCALLILAGLYQFTSFKQACLKHCRSPADFLAQHRPIGIGGSLKIGMIHGLFCLGCCWILMALLFVGGVMNLFWIVGLAVYVVIEKAAAKLPMLDRLMGIILILGGVFLFMA
jgi:predicted metal-binding membrane protein